MYDMLPRPFQPSGFWAPLGTQPLMRDDLALTREELAHARSYLSPGARVCWWWRYAWNAGSPPQDEYKPEYLWMLLENEVLEWTGVPSESPCALLQLTPPINGEVFKSAGTMEVHLTLLMIKTS